MKTSSIFWGVLLIVMGGLFLLNNLGLLTFTIDSIRQFWPLILILLGVSYLVGNAVITRVMIVISAVIFGLVVWTFLPFSKALKMDKKASWEIMDPDEPVEPLTSNQYLYMEKLNSASAKAKLKLRVGAGEFTISDTTNELFAMQVNTDFGKYTVNRESDEDTEKIDVRMRDSKLKLINIGGKNLENKCLIRLNASVPWELDLNLGAADARFDLSQFYISRVNLDAGAASISLKLGDLADTTYIQVKTGVSSIKIDIPKASGCEVVSNSGLSNFDFDNLIAKGKGRHQSSNFDAAPKKIFIKLETGISSVELSRY